MDITKNQLKKDRQRFGGLRYIVLTRDEFRCILCGMSQSDHQDRWRKSLTINHINGIGRNHPTPDNRLSNLETLCLVCHGKKDGPRWMQK